jgi:hypothetical protein
MASNSYMHHQRSRVIRVFRGSYFLNNKNDPRIDTKHTKAPQRDKRNQARSIPMNIETQIRIDSDEKKPERRLA